MLRDMTVLCGKIIKSFLTLIFISSLLLYPAFAQKPKNIILEANGQGESQSQAISNALNILSQQIYVFVEAQSKASESLNNDSFSSNIENTSVLSSTGYFQNISIYNEKKSKKGFELNVGLTSESISSSIEYLFLQLKQSEIYSLSKSKLREQLSMANFLFSLISYAKANNIAYQSITHQGQSVNLSEYIAELNKILSTDAQLKFVVYPQNTDAKISIEQTLYDPYKNIYLPKGVYFFELKASGYKTMQNSFELNKGDNLELEIYLQKQLKTAVPVRIKVVNETKLGNSVLYQSVKKIVSNNQMKEDSNSSNYIEFHLSEKKSDSIISGYTNNSVDVLIKARINGVDKSELVAINNLAKNNKEQDFQDNVISQINTKSQMFFARLFD